jgi:hypothetical protein
MTRRKRTFWAKTNNGYALDGHMSGHHKFLLLRGLCMPVFAPPTNHFKLMRFFKTWYWNEKKMRLRLRILLNEVKQLCVNLKAS